MATFTVFLMMFESKQWKNTMIHRSGDSIFVTVRVQQHSELGELEHSTLQSAHFTSIRQNTYCVIVCVCV